MDIQNLVQESGVPRRTIHFYVQQGVLPPPQGAGLAASYAEEHLLRLRLIPVLRQQGLRLDEIRARFQGMSSEEMRHLLQQSPPPELAQQSPASLPRMDQPGWQTQRYAHYLLPEGVTLLVPEEISAEGKQQVQQLLEAAHKILGVVSSSTNSQKGKEKPDALKSNGFRSGSEEE